MKKTQKITSGLVIIAIGILVLGTDRIFVSADNASYGQSMTYLTIIALLIFLIGSIWLFRTMFD